MFNGCPGSMDARGWMPGGGDDVPLWAPSQGGSRQALAGRLGAAPPAERAEIATVQVPNASVSARLAARATTDVRVRCGWPKLDPASDPRSLDRRASIMVFLSLEREMQEGRAAAGQMTGSRRPSPSATGHFYLGGKRTSLLWFDRRGSDEDRSVNRAAALTLLKPCSSLLSGLTRWVGIRLDLVTRALRLRLRLGRS